MLYNSKAIEIMLRKAKEKYESATDDFDKERYDSCISNLYYSSFQTLSAYMISKGQFVSKHTQARAYVNKELANKRLISKESARLYNALMDDRSDADYDIESFDAEEAKTMLDGVRHFNDEILQLMK